MLQWLVPRASVAILVAVPMRIADAAQDAHFVDDVSAIGTAPTAFIEHRQPAVAAADLSIHPLPPPRQRRVARPSPLHPLAALR